MGETTASPQPAVEVYAVHGAEPEVQAYGMARYSRSALSMKQSLQEINEQKAEKFLNTFYFQYGHRSIADLAHVALAIERLSILAAIVLVDEQRWDGQERSTRYQDFKKSGFHAPDFGGNAQAQQLYTETAQTLFREYEALSEWMWRYLAERTPKPPEMKPEMYERTLRARAFDISRYLLPLATNTSLGEIVNARTLEAQIARLLSHTHGEVRVLGEQLKRAAREPAYNINHQSWRRLVDEIRARDAALGEQAQRELLKDVRVASTLVKYAEANAYEMRTRAELRQAAGELMDGVPLLPARRVDLLDDEPLEIELAATLLYEHCHHPYREIRKQVEGLNPAQREEIIALGTRHRGQHDELLRAFSAGQRLRFDILMDIGGFRDMHRHRRCVQIGQGFTTAHGFDSPDEVTAAATEVQRRYEQLMNSTAAAVEELRGALQHAGDPEAEGKSQYLIPLAYRKRTLFKMDFAEAVYIAELRTTPAGHVAYRRVAWDMFKEVSHRYPALGKYFRVHDINQPVDLLQR